ncbi:hypothetical protein CH373_15765 [Leptospira perolatii]|uniref:Uncharacterized protein n=1 Tax=Leptospira perolatii TaxID=2023191 RepID=A0A2M9ZJG4_9LEPT|nr:hypothetical protein CH360_14225 [Leptospira perolatii]PJZ72198.1 hypothetical protein CH373_15765 [Leptospira perolatii]
MKQRSQFRNDEKSESKRKLTNPNFLKDLLNSMGSIGKFTEVFLIAKSLISPNHNLRKTMGFACWFTCCPSVFKRIDSSQ